MWTDRYACTPHRADIDTELFCIQSVNFHNKWVSKSSFSKYPLWWMLAKVLASGSTFLCSYQLMGKWNRKPKQKFLFWCGKQEQVNAPPITSMSSTCTHNNSTPPFLENFTRQNHQKHQAKNRIVFNCSNSSAYQHIARTGRTESSV